MKSLLLIICLAGITALDACANGHDPFLEGVDPKDVNTYSGEPTKIEGIWESVGMLGNPCVLETPVFIPEDLLAKLKFTFRGDEFEYLDARHNGCESPGDIMFYFVIKGKFTLADNSINLKVSSMTMTLGDVGYNTLIFMPTGIWWGVAADNWKLGVAVDIAGKNPNSYLAANRSPAVRDVMPGIWQLNGTTLLVGFDKTPADGYAAPQGAIEYTKK